jgi:ElaB/YqjD/DUF883 family membrane-anchored ribosome-binding protein
VNAETIEAAKREAEAARRRLDSTLVALQQRLHPKALATEAWDGVKDKSNDLAEGAMDAVKQRPGAVSLAVGAAFLFLARKPIGRAVGKVFSSGEEDDGRIVTTVETDNENYNAAAPVITAPLGKGVN